MRHISRGWLAGACDIDSIGTVFQKNCRLTKRRHGNMDADDCRFLTLPD
jgi:hypothetical protein